MRMFEAIKDKIGGLLAGPSWKLFEEEIACTMATLQGRQTPATSSKRWVADWSCQSAQCLSLVVVYSIRDIG